MTFKSSEIEHQLRWKNNTSALSAEAKRAGLYTGPSRDRPKTRSMMFLHESRVEENLLPATREEALAFFRANRIPWHDGPEDGRRPSNYLMDSMVSCVNCLMPFAHDGAALAALLRPLVRDAVHAIAIEEGRVLTFEWMGDGNPLGERSPKRKRGSYGTSVDAYCALRRADGGCTAILIEWKYTESYLGDRPKHGTFYRPLLEDADGPIDLATSGGTKALFFDPLYQLARLHLLADATVRAPGSFCDRAIVVVIVPETNLAYRGHVPGSALRGRFTGLSLPEVWSRLLRRPEQFALTSFDALLSQFAKERFPSIQGAIREARERYERRIDVSRCCSGAIDGRHGWNGNSSAGSLIPS